MINSIWRSLFILVIGSLCTLQCLPDSEPNSVKVNEMPRVVSGKSHTVMIIDSDIDFKNPAYAHLVQASYVINCDFGSYRDDQLFGNAMTRAFEALSNFRRQHHLFEESHQQSLEVVKASYLDSYRRESTKRISRCRLAENPTDSAINNKEFPHGTLVSGIIGSGMTDVSLVLVKVKFDELFDNDGLNLTTSSKIADLFVELHKDKEVLDAYLSIPNPIKEYLFTIANKHNVSVINNSWGKREGLLAPLFFASLTDEYQSLIEQLPKMRDSQWNLDSFLEISAAGNEKKEISVNTEERCSKKNTLLVGALDQDGTRSSFSNFGDCVHFFILGNNVRVPIDIAGFVPPAEGIRGTSFAAPLLTRYIVSNFPRGADRDSILAKLSELADTERHLPLSLIDPIFLSSKEL